MATKEVTAPNWKRPDEVGKLNINYKLIINLL